MAIRPEFIQTLQEKGYSQDMINNALQESGYGGMTQTMGTQGLGQQTGATGLGGQPSQSTFGLMSALGPRLAGAEIGEGDYKTGYDILDKLFSTQQEQEELEKEKKIKLEAIDESIDILKKNPDLTGPVQGRTTLARIKLNPAFKGIFGEPSEDETKLWNLLSSSRVEKLFDLGGKQLPRHEMDALKGVVPDMTLSADQNIQQLKQLRKNFADFADEVIETGDYQGGAIEGSSINDFAERYYK